MKKLLVGIALMSSLVLARTATAQTTPATSDPSRIETPKPILPNFERSPVVKGGSPQVQAPDMAIPQGAEKVKFTLSSILFSGNTVFDDATLKALYSEHIGKEISLADSYEIARKVTLHYREQGYFLTRVILPPQEIKNGILRMRVLEGEISDFEIQGTLPESTKSQIARYAKQIVAEKPLTVQRLERQLMLMNDMPGVAVKSVLSPSATQEGTASMTLVASFTPWQAIAGVDTFGNNFIGPERVLANVQRHGIVKGIDSVSLTGVMAPDHDEMAYGDIQLTSLMGGSGLKLQLGASHTYTSPSLTGALGSVLGTQGHASQLNADLSYPLYRSRDMRWQALGGFRLSENSTQFAEGFEALETFDHLRVAHIGTRLEASDSWQGTNFAELALYQGIEAFGASKKGDSALSRAKGDPGFTKVSAELSRTQSVSTRWSVLAATSGQWSANPLLVAEEFGVGGQSYGRGFDSSEITGDHGVAGKLEVQYLTPWNNDWLNGAQLYGFYDIGATWDRDPSVGDPVRRSLSSAGIGSRVQLFQRTTGDIFFAKPLTNQIASRASDKQDDWRMQFTVRVSY